MKILLYEWNAYGQELLQYYIEHEGNEVECYRDDRIINEEAEALVPLCAELEKGYDLIFSYNFFTVIAEAAHHHQIRYVCWSYDAPLLALYHEKALYHTNIFFLFDRYQYSQMLKLKNENVYYLPLAVDTVSMGEVISTITDEERAAYQSDLSFVGNTYSERDKMLYGEQLPKYYQGYFEGIVNAVTLLPGNMTEELIPRDVWSQFKQMVRFEGDEYSTPYEVLFSNIVGMQATVRERSSVLKVVSNMFDFALYTGSNNLKLPVGVNRGKVHYKLQMPKVFSCSKINLNITMKNIISGIPLRALDIMACGGFLLSNAQAELLEWFQEGKEFAAFSSKEELTEKANYYLAHDAIRKQIAQNGYEKVQKEFSYEKKIAEIFQIIKTM